MAIEKKLLDLLRCPITKSRLQPLAEEQIRAINRLIVKHRLHYSDGERVSSQLEQALITENGATIYRVDSGIPVMLREKAIDATQLGDLLDVPAGG